MHPKAGAHNHTVCAQYSILCNMGFWFRYHQSVCSGTMRHHSVAGLVAQSPMAYFPLFNELLNGSHLQPYNNAYAVGDIVFTEAVEGRVLSKRSEFQSYWAPSTWCSSQMPRVGRIFVDIAQQSQKAGRNSLNQQPGVLAAAKVDKENDMCWEKRETAQT